MNNEPAADLTPEQLQRLLDAQRAAQAADPIPDVATRRDRIDRFVAAVLEHRTELAAALDADFGAGRHCLSHGIDATLVACHARQLATGSPTPIAIHDDSNVARNALCLGNGARRAEKTH